MSEQKTNQEVVELPVDPATPPVGAPPVIVDVFIPPLPPLGDKPDPPAAEPPKFDPPNIDVVQVPELDPDPPKPETQNPQIQLKPQPDPDSRFDPISKP